MIVIGDKLLLYMLGNFHDLFLLFTTKLTFFLNNNNNNAIKASISLDADQAR